MRQMVHWLEAAHYNLVQRIGKRYPALLSKPPVTTACIWLYKVKEKPS
jgi:hypothetical protein